jgi:iron complex transport system substrate-binding protein
MAAQGEVLAERIEQQVNAQLQRVGQSPAPQVLLLMGAGGRGLMAAGTGTKAQAMLDLVGARNVIDYQGYKPVNAEAAVQAAPEVIIVANTGAAKQDEVASMLAMTPAARNQAVHGIDASLLLGFGPRLPQALDAILTLMHQPALTQE